MKKIMRAAMCGVVTAAVALCCTDCNRTAAPQAKEAGHHEHKAYHNGCLNAVHSCDNGHAEVRIEGDVLKLWFVGGGNDTNRSVRVPDPEIVLTELSAKLKHAGDGPVRQIVLKATPNALAEEKVGDCATFEGRADWLKDLKEFHATGSVTFKGKKEELRIDYPEGYDPD